MSIAGLDVFDRTVHTTNRWLQELMGLLDGGSRHDAYVALRATLHALRDRLPVEETAYEGWDPTGKPVRERSLEGFLAGVAVELPIDADPEPVARAVFALLARRVSDGEIQDVKGVLPTAIRQLWPAAPRAARADMTITPSRF